MVLIKIYQPVADTEEGPGGPAPTLFLDQTEAQRTEKNLFWDTCIGQ